MNLLTLYYRKSLNKHHYQLVHGIYTVTAYDIVNGSVYGPAVHYSAVVSVLVTATLSASSISSVIRTNSKYIKTLCIINYYC